jgi:flagellar biogenesis protein FliO
VDTQVKEQPEIKMNEVPDSNSKPRLTSSKPLPAIWSVLGKLGAVILLLCLLAALVKKAKSTPAGMTWLLKVGKFAQKKLNKDRDMIQVISTHHLDPKKSLAVVKVAGRLLVLGVTHEAINLITQIPGEGDAASFLDGESDLGFTPTKFSEDPAFADFLGLAKGKGIASREEPPSLVPSARSRIKNRLEGLKQL